MLNRKFIMPSYLLRKSKKLNNLCKKKIKAKIQYYNCLTNRVKNVIFHFLKTINKMKIVWKKKS